MLERLRRRILYWLRSGERDRLLREEMESHVAMLSSELMEEGSSRKDAEAAARKQFGNFLRHQERSRESWISQWWSDVRQDAVFAMRGIRKQPGFALTAGLSAALGIGACSLIFGIANFALFQPLPVREPNRLMSISGIQTDRGRLGQSMSFPDVQDLRAARSFEGIAAFFPFMPATISTGGEPQRYWGSFVTANYFDVVRPAFAVGRGFDPTRDDKPGETPVVVLSHQLWQSRFAGDPTIVGRTIVLNGRKVVVAGVTAAGFRGTEVMFFSDFWVPLSMTDSLADAGMGGDRLRNRGSQWLLAAGRLRSGVGEREAAAEIGVIGDRLRTSYPATNAQRAFHIETAGQINPGIRRYVTVFFLMLLVVAGLVLFTACANIANLLLAKSSARRQEIATRLAIGAGRGRLVRQLLTESVILAVLGGIGGLVIAMLGIESIGRARLPMAMPVDLSISLDYRVMLFCIVLSAFTGVIFGLAPALRATRPELVGALKDEQVKAGRARGFQLRNALVVAQVAVCMVLLICSGLFVRSLYSANRVDTGLGHTNLLLVAFDPSLNRYSKDEAKRIVDAVTDRTAALPGVESIALTSSVPLTMEGTQNGFSIESDDTAKERGAMMADIYSVGPRFFDTFGIRMVEGEDFAPGIPADDIVIANQALADKAFPKQNPLGRTIRYLGRRVRITGIVATTKSRSLGEDPHPCLYFPIARDFRGNDSLTGMTLAVRTKGEPGNYTQAVLRTFRDVDPALALFDVRTMEAHLQKALILPRASAFLFGIAGCMGLLIATVGPYGVIAFTVARQTKEIGIRMALGAQRGQVLRRMLAEGMAMTLMGSAIGLALALSLSRVAASFLYGVSPTDSLTFMTVPLLLAGVALVACFIPARRAASLDPLRALRYE